MALPTVTQAAVRRIRQLVSDCTSERPIVAVIWVPPATDKKRGKDGETVWIDLEAHWKVFVGDFHLAEGFDESRKPEITRIAELDFWFCPAPEAPSLKGRTIDDVAGELVVR
jgi:hypothetical protein